MLNETTHLVGDVWSCFANVSIHLPHHTNMVITVEKRVFFFSSIWTLGIRMRSAISLETGVGEDYDQSACVLVGRSDWCMLFSD